jgi:hypothetical protein
MMGGRQPRGPGRPAGVRSGAMLMGAEFGAPLVDFLSARLVAAGTICPAAFAQPHAVRDGTRQYRRTA